MTIRFRIIITCLVLAVACCGPKPKSKVRARPKPKAPPTSTQKDKDKTGKEGEEGAKEFSKSSDLTLVTTGSDLKAAKSGVATLEGTGKTSTYKLIYKFNSGASTALKILDGHLNVQVDGDCSEPSAKLSLVSKDGATPVSSKETAAVKPNTDYALEVAFEHSCQKLTISSELLVWGGSAGEEPKIANVCSGKAGPISFVIEPGSLEAFSTEKFLTADFYCGEDIKDATDKNCSVTPVEPGEGFGKPRISAAQCSAMKASEKKSYQAIFDPAGSSVNVTCNTGEKESFAEVFSACQMKIVDYKSLVH